jgi:hypothetical protein
MSWLACGCYDKLFICLQKKNFCKKTAFVFVILIQMERKGSLFEKIAKDVEDVTSSLLPKKSRDAV